MYIHLGNNSIVSAQDVVAIVNLNFLESEEIKNIMETAREEKKLIDVSEKDKEKSLIICEDKLYVSPISSITLYKRSISYQ